MNNPLQQKPTDRPDVIVKPPYLYGGALLVAFFLRAMITPRDLDLPGVVIGLFMTAGGVILLAWAIQEFRRAGTNFQCDQPVTALVTSGPYRYSRNPIYVALNLLYLGIGLFFDNLWVVLLWPFLLVIMHMGVIVREEEFMAGKFGAEYNAYRDKVGRWLTFKTISF